MGKLILACFRVAFLAAAKQVSQRRQVDQRDTTAQVLAFLEAHPRVRRVYSPQAQDGDRRLQGEHQLRGASGLLTLELDAPDVAAVERFCNGLTRFLMTVSWGGYESLAFPVCAVFPPDAPLHPRAGLPLSLVRLSIGLEEADVLMADLDAALTRI